MSKGLPPKLRGLIREDVQAMHAYAVQDAVDMIKLDAMENPFSLPAPLQDELGRRLGRLALNRYPGRRVEDLRTALAAYAGMPAGHDIVLGNGSDELISMLAMACRVPQASILAPMPGFVMYEMSARLQGLTFHSVPLRPNFELDLVPMLAAITRHRPTLTYLAYPNNPTANLWDDLVVAKIIAAVGDLGGLVVIDEAYQPFAARSWIDRIRANPQAHGHVLLMRTMSKFGLAGVRIGYMMGPKALIGEVEKVRPPYNISVLNCEAALFALEHAEVFAVQAEEIKSQRAIILQALSALPEVTVWPSDANMVLVRVPDAKKTFEAMKARRILVKNVSAMHPLLANCLRLTVGSSLENQQMLVALKDSL